MSTIPNPETSSRSSIVDLNSGNLLTVNADGSINASATISGTVTANIGTTNGLALDTTVAKLNISQGATLGANTGPMIQGSVSTSNPVYITGQISPLSLTTTGSLRTDNTTWLGSTAPTVGQKTSANSIPVTLASDQPSISISGAPSSDLINGKVFYAAIDNYNLAFAGTNNPIFLFKNPIGSGKTIYIFSVTGNCKITNVQVTFLMFKNPTITTNGTVFTPVNANFGSDNTSVLNVFTNSTVSSSGILVIIDQVGQNSNSSNMIITERVAVPPGQNMLISGSPFSNNRAIIETVGWVEI